MAVESVITVNAMKALPTSSLVDGQALLVLGYYAAGDGGGGLFRWSAASTSIDNDGTVIKPNSNPAAGRWLRIYDEPLNIRWFGADPAQSGSVNGLAIQAALDLAYSEGGGRVEGAAGSFPLSGTLVIGSFVSFDGRNCELLQSSDNVPVFAVTKSPFNQGWAIENVNVRYATQQTAVQTGAYGIQLAAANVNSYRGRVQNVSVRNACGAVVLPELAGCTGFFIELINVVASQCSSWGFDLLGGVVGAQTNLLLRHCWVVQSSTPYIGTSAGFRIKRTYELTIDDCGADRIQQTYPLYLEQCYGRVGSFAIEACAFTASSGQLAYALFSACEMSVDLLTAGDNVITISAGGAAEFGVIWTGASRLWINKIRDLNSTFTKLGGATGGYYAVFVSGTGSLVKNDSYATTGSTPGLQFADFSVPRQVRVFNGIDLTSLSTSVMYDPPPLANGSGVQTAVTVVGANLGDYVLTSFSSNLQGLAMSASVSSADTVTVRFQNQSGATVDLPSGTLRVRVLPQ